MAVLLLCWLPLRADLSAAKMEPNLEKRSEKALDNAAAAFKTAHEAYQTGDWKSTQAALDELRQSVELAWDSLQQSGKNARKSPKYFKRAELRTRELDRRLEDFARQAGIDDRPAIEKVQQRVDAIHEELLLAVMSKR